MVFLLKPCHIREKADGRVKNDEDEDGRQSTKIVGKAFTIPGQPAVGLLGWFAKRNRLESFHKKR